MSVASKNLFAVLDEEQSEGAAAPAVPVGVKKTTSSKKTDTAPPKANPARANPNRKQPTGNEAAFRDKNVGRSTNRSKGSPTETETGAAAASRAPRRPKDRQSATGKKDTSKRVSKGWGDNKKQLEEEAAGESIAKADAAEAETAAVEEPDNTKTLDDYFAELSVKKSEVAPTRAVRQANEGQDDSKWQNAAEIHKEEEQLFEATRTKTVRSKAKKEKTVIEPEFGFASPRSDRPQRTGGPRGGRGGPRGGPRGGARSNTGKRGGQQNVASVDLGSSKEFPSLGA